MPTRAAIIATCDAYLAAVGAGDPDAVMALYADEPTIEDPVGSDLRVGREAVRAFYAGLAGTKMTLTRMGPVTVVGDQAAFLFRLDVPVGDDTLVMASIDTMTFDDDGKILTMVAYADGEANPDSP